MRSKPETPPPDEEGNSLGWHALNYRSAHTVHAQARWLELERYVNALTETAYQAGLERAAEIADRNAAGLTRQGNAAFPHIARSIAASIRAEEAGSGGKQPPAGSFMFARSLP